MSFLKPAPGLDDKPDLHTPTVYSKQYRHSIVDTEYVPHTSLLHNVSGQPIRCDYYRQYLGQDEEVVGLQLNDIATYQSYTEIRNLVYKRDGDPSRNWNSERYEVSQTWNGYFLFDLQPLKSDIFVEDIGDGRAGLVQIVNTPEFMSIARDKVYLCECILLAEMTQEIEDNIKSKVVETSWFSAESALKGGHAIITATDRELNGQLDRWAYMISQHLLTTHYWNPERTIAIRDVNEYTYDPFLVRYLQRVIPHKYIPGANPIESLNFSVGRNFKYDKELTIWDCFTQGSFDFLPMIDRKLYRYNRTSMMNTRGYTGFLATKFDYILLPSKLEFNELNPLYRARDNGLAYRPPVEEPEEHENYFSEAFYAGSYANEFERWCKEFFGDRTVDREKLLKLCQDYANWEPRDQIYRSGLLISAIMISKRVFGG
ncbi:phage protein [Vibrio phage pTD1]|uniref:Phage protein n=1 Tax=Vibrio phage pTD1 TaxID=1938577 RepID=A0A1Q2U2V8_9CAUD|nr:virion structural protein [Vibrio phage pTD1]BAW98291.1 phage protein [Vibrio phage pTD1]